MSKGKKSNDETFTRIEDLGEYLHELNDSDEDSGEVDAISDTETSEISNETPDFGINENSFESSDSPFEEADPFAIGETDTSDMFDTFALTEEPKESDSEEKEPASLDELISVPEAEDDSEALKSIETDEKDDLDFLQEKTQTQTYIPEPIESLPSPPEPTSSYKQPETFEEVKKFAENSSFTGMGVEGNPSFSVLIKNVRFIEDVNDIISLMRELQLLMDTEEAVKSRLSRGHLLIPRISEYAAIFLSHKLRRFDIDIQVGLSDEIHPPKHHEAPETGMVSKHSLYQNQSHYFQFDDSKLELSQIMVAATSTLEGYQVVKYLGVGSEHKMLESHVVEDETSEEIPRIYHELAMKLKAHALKSHANAVVGLNYQLTPLPSEYGMSGQKYRLSCTGNLVWVNKL